MPKNIKIFFAILVLGAILSVFSLTDYFHQGKAFSFNFKNMLGNLSFKTDIDPDNDGLDNIDESYWNTDFQNPDTDGDSFLDGEEVASGHDPTKAGPNDLLRDTNLTDKLAELTASGLYEGSLKPGSLNYEKSLTDLSQYAADNAAVAINKAVSPSVLKLVDSTHENQNKYLSQVYEVMKDFLVAYGNELGHLKDNLDIIGASGFKDKRVIDYSMKDQKIFTEIYNRSTGIQVPKNWQNEHLNLLGEMKIAIESNRAILAGENDPVKAAMAFDYLAQILERIPSWTNRYIEKNRTENVNNVLIEDLSR